MEWTADHQQELYRFLSDFTNPAPQVQAHNLGQLSALSQQPNALTAVCGVVCDTSANATVRLSATTVARQLLRRQTALSFYAQCCASPSSNVDAPLESLVANLLDASFHDLSAAHSTSLQRATTSLLATIVKAMAVEDDCLALAMSAWSHLVSYLLQATAAAAHDTTFSTSLLKGAAQVAALLRELCEVALAASRPLREWVGGQFEQSMTLCNLFLQQLHVLQFALTSRQPADGGVQTCSLLATWMENLVSAFSSCMTTGALPSTTPDFLGSVHDEATEGPAAHALRTVATAAAQVHTEFQELTLKCILQPLAQLDEESVRSGDGAAAAAHLLQSSAPFVAVAMRYMADAVMMEVFDVQNGTFQNCAMPLLMNYCVAAAQIQLLYDGAGEPDSVHAAVLACVNYAAQLVHVEHFLGLAPSCVSAAVDQTETYVAYVHRMLVSAGTLPTAIVEQLPERTAQVPDTAAEMLVKTASARRRKQPGGAPAAGASSPSEDDADDVADGYAMADALEAQLPDNGTLRQAVAWAANSLTCKAEWLAALTPLVTQPVWSQSVDGVRETCATEASLFVCNETVDALLVDRAASNCSSSARLSNAAFGELLQAQVASVVALLPQLTPSDASHTAASPAYIRVQAVRFFGRLTSGLLEVWKTVLRNSSDGVSSDTQWIAQCSYTTLQPVGGLEKLLWALTQALCAETNKAVQVECVQTLTSILTGCIRVTEAAGCSAGNGKGKDDSELEEESLGDDSSDDNVSPAEVANAHSAHALIGLFCQSVGLTPGVAALPQTVQLVSEHFSHFQWSVRQGVYHLLSEVLPGLWTLSSEQPSALASSVASELACMKPLAVSATARALEVLAGHYMQLLSDVHASLFEMASLLSCMADVATEMDAEALEGVLPWIVQVTQHVLNLYEAYLAQRGSQRTGAGVAGFAEASAAVDMTDMCMVSLDLISCVCDRLIDRDALLAVQLRCDDSTRAAAMDARVRALVSALLHSAVNANVHDSASGASPSSVDALPNRCLALLRLCQSLPDHPTRATCTSACSAKSLCVEDAPRSSDEFGEVRRACFAILYDCVFVMAYADSLFRPSLASSASVPSGGGSISDALGRSLYDLCLREVLPRSETSGGVGAGPLEAELLKVVSMHNAAASDAWLCLGALLSLWDQQHCLKEQQRHLQRVEGGGAAPDGTVEHTAESSAETGPVSLLLSSSDGCVSQCQLQYAQATFEALLAVLADKKFVTASYLKLNMTSAACGFATLLASAAATIAFASPSSSLLSSQALSALFGVGSSARVREFAPDAAAGDASGVSEAAQILWCLGRVWHEAVQPLPHDAVCVLLRTRGKDLAKTAAWLMRCASALGKAPPAELLSYWQLLLALWRPIAQTLLQAAQAGVLSLTVAQTPALRQLAQA